MKGQSGLIVAAALLATSCATVPSQAPPPLARGSAGAVVASNDMLANAVYAKLNADPMYYYRHVDVRVDQGVAHLSGYVWSSDALYRARQLARSVPGVTGVVTSQLELERNGRSNGVTR